MYLNLGHEKIVTYDEIIGIFDLDNTTVSKITRETLKKCEKNGTAETIGFDLPKSYILCAKNKGDSKIYISPTTCTTLTKRINNKTV